MSGKNSSKRRQTISGSRVRAVCQEMLEKDLAQEEIMRRIKRRRGRKTKIKTFAMERRFICQQIEALFVKLHDNPPDRLGLEKIRRARILVPAIDKLMRGSI